MGNGCISRLPDYVVFVKTGDKKGAGTDANVYCALHDVNDTRSKDTLLDNFATDDFEAGRTDRFNLYDVVGLDDIKDFEVWRDSSGANDDWFVEHIVVERVRDKKQFMFPVHRWIEEKEPLVLSEFDCVLPQDDPHKKQRARELDTKKSIYKGQRYSKGLPMAATEVPKTENFSNEYQWDIAKTKAKLILKAKISTILSPKWSTLNDMNNVYNSSLGVPYGFTNWKEDVEFGRQRLQGCNTTTIKLCTSIPNNFPVTADMVEPFLEGNSLEDALEAKKIYILDYAVLDGIKCSHGRKVCAPLGLFYVNKEKDLMPVAIQLEQNPSEDNPIFLPTDPEYTWMMAKMWFNLSDASIHQSTTHLGMTHLLMESICIITHRNLAISHPIFRLLAPHFLYLIAINSLAVVKLLCEGGWIDRCMTIGPVGVFEIVVLQWKNWRMDVDGTLPADLKNRGVYDSEALPNYHYRDDALLMWHCIARYCRRVVEGHYDSPEKLTEDYELQSWAKEMVDSEENGGAHVKGVPGNGKFDNVDDLVACLTSIIFISSVGHAASNFAQYDEYAFPANYPAFLKGERPTSKEPLEEKDILDALPDKTTTLDTATVTKILSSRGTNALGDFEMAYTFDPVGTKALEQFRAELEEIDIEVKARDAARVSKYPYLAPSEIPNAISI